MGLVSSLKKVRKSGARLYYIGPSSAQTFLRLLYRIQRKMNVTGYTRTTVPTVPVFSSNPTRQESEEPSVFEFLGSCCVCSCSTTEYLVINPYVHYTQWYYCTVLIHFHFYFHLHYHFHPATNLGILFNSSQFPTFSEHCPRVRVKLYQSLCIRQLSTVICYLG